MLLWYTAANTLLTTFATALTIAPSAIAPPARVRWGVARYAMAGTTWLAHEMAKRIGDRAMRVGRGPDSLHRGGRRQGGTAIGPPPDQQVGAEDEDGSDLPRDGEELDAPTLQEDPTERRGERGRSPLDRETECDPEPVGQVDGELFRRGGAAEEGPGRGGEEREGGEGADAKIEGPDILDGRHQADAAKEEEQRAHTERATLASGELPFAERGEETDRHDRGIDVGGDMVVAELMRHPPSHDIPDDADRPPERERARRPGPVRGQRPRDAGHELSDGGGIQDRRDLSHQAPRSRGRSSLTAGPR